MISMIRATWVILVFLMVLHSGQLQDCLYKRWLPEPNERLLYAADLVLYGKDSTPLDSCPPTEPNCDSKSRLYREHSYFDVYCVMKGDGKEVQGRITIQPEVYGSACAQTRFERWETGWEYLVMLKRGPDNVYYWNEVNPNQKAYMFVFTNDELNMALNVCGFQDPKPPKNVKGDAKSCPKIQDKISSCYIGCPKGWHQLNNRCYKMSDFKTERGTQKEAAAQCFLQHSWLLSLETEAERDSIWETIAAYNDTDWWTTGVARYNTWVWLRGSTGDQFTYTEWRPSEPDGEEGEPLGVSVLYQPGRWGWSDQSPDTVLPYICEKELGREKFPTSDCSRTQTQSELDACLNSVRMMLTTADFWRDSAKRWECNSRLPIIPTGDDCPAARAMGSSALSRIGQPRGIDIHLLDRILNVTVHSGQGCMSACGRDLGCKAASTFSLNPLDDTKYGVWYSRESGVQLDITWQAGDHEQHTLILLDLTRMNVHGAWINIPGNSLDKGQVVQEYRGAAIPSVYGNVSMAFLLFKQTQRLDLTQQDVDILTYQNFSTTPFDLYTFLNSTKLTGPVAVQLWHLVPDNYTLHYLDSVHKYIDPCLSKNTDFFEGVQSPLIPDDGVFYVEAQILYKVPPIRMMFCCHDIGLPEYRAVISNNGSHQLEPWQARSTPKLNLRKVGAVLQGTRNGFLVDELHTLVMLADSMTSTPYGTPTEPVVHWLVTNIPGGQVEEGTEVVEYFGPQPPGGEVYNYLVFILKQKNYTEVDMKTLAMKCADKYICKFNYREFTREHEVTLVGGTWFTSSIDAYTVYRRIKAGRAQHHIECPLIWPDLQIVRNLVVCPSIPASSPAGITTSCNVLLWFLALLVMIP